MPPPSFKLAQASEVDKNQAGQLNAQGMQQFANNQFTEALQSWQQALTLYQQLDDPQNQALVLTNLGSTYLALKQYAQAQPSYEQALKLAQKIGNRQVQVEALNGLGNLADAQGQYAQSLQRYQQALDLAQTLPVAGANPQSNPSLNLYLQTIRSYQQLLELQEQVGKLSQPDAKFQANQANALTNLGLAYFTLKQYPQAIQFYQKALSLGQRLQLPLEMEKNWRNLGDAYLAQGQQPRAIQAYQQALMLVQQRGDRTAEMQIQASLKRAETMSAPEVDPAQIIVTNNRVTDNRKAQVTTLRNRANVAYRVGLYEAALQFYQQALPLTQQLRDPQGEAEIINNLGNVAFAQEHYGEAQTLYRQALKLAQEVGDRSLQMQALNNLGLVATVLQESDVAASVQQQALTLARTLKDAQGEAYALINIGFRLEQTQQVEQALPFYQQALQILQSTKDLAAESVALNSLGSALMKTNRWEEAGTLFQQSIQKLEQLRLGLSDEAQVSLFEQQTRTNSNLTPSPYHNLQKVLIHQNKVESALEVAEQGRARAFVELLAQRQSATPTRAEVTTAPTIAKIKAIAKAQQATLVEYTLIDNQTLYIWVVQSSGEVFFRQVNYQAVLATLTEQLSLDRLVATTRESIGVRDGGIAFEENSALVARALDTILAKASINQRLQGLHRLLIQPVADLLPQDANQTIIFVPQGPLFLVPFAALQDSTGKYLIEQHTLATVPAIQVLELTQQRRRSSAPVSSQDLLVVGNPLMPTPLPELPGAEAEAKAIAILWHTQPLLGAQATKATVLQRMQTARFIHLATHGVLNGAVPLDSAIALTPAGQDSGFLTAAELMDVRLKADLVVLSACNTGRGLITGDGVIGLSRSLLAAGAPTAIVSLWAVSDGATADLMPTFYINLQRSLNKAQALRQAMLKTLKEHPDPLDWAAFTLVGETN